MGSPLREDGTENRLAERILRFAQRLLKDYTCPLLLWDESLSSQRAQNLFPGRKNIDALAATLILGEVLEKMR